MHTCVEKYYFNFVNRDFCSDQILKEWFYCFFLFSWINCQRIKWAFFFFKEKSCLFNKWMINGIQVLFTLYINSYLRYFIKKTKQCVMFSIKFNKSTTEYITNIMSKQQCHQSFTNWSLRWKRTPKQVWFFFFIKVKVSNKICLHWNAIA